MTSLYRYSKIRGRPSIIGCVNEHINYQVYSWFVNKKTTTGTELDDLILFIFVAKIAFSSP
jgi:hypothetical protein